MGIAVNLLYVNGEWVSASEARVAAADRALLFGYGLFETVRVHRGRALCLPRHLARLRRSAPVLGLALPWSAEEIGALVSEAVARHSNAGGSSPGLMEGAVRLTVTAGPGPVAASGGGPPGLVISVREGEPYPPALYERGFRAVWASGRRNHRSPLCRVKSLNFLDNLLARREAEERGADEALLLNADGDLAEGAVTNVFFVRGDRLCTPDLGSGALPGVARGVLLDLIGVERGLGLSAEQGRYSPADLLAADEAFLTNALLGVMPLVAVDGRPVGTGRPGPVTLCLRQAYEALLTP